jgi:hypothetical protein
MIYIPNETVICIWPGGKCNRKQYGRGLCGKHYQRAKKLGIIDQFQFSKRSLKRTKSVSYVKNINETNFDICIWEDCTQIPHARGLCKKHYQLGISHGVLEQFPIIRGKIPKKKKQCLQVNCDRDAVAKGLCSAHWKRNQKGQDMDLPVRNFRGRSICLWNNCEKVVQKFGLCYVHADRKKRGAPMDGPTPLEKSRQKSIKDVKWSKDKSGYVTGSLHGKRRIQHRCIMEEKIGRELFKFENVHHINGIRDDNRIENLELWTKPQPCGQRPEDLVSWVIDHYRELVEARLALF